MLKLNKVAFNFDAHVNMKTIIIFLISHHLDAWRQEYQDD